MQFADGPIDPGRESEVVGIYNESSHWLSLSTFKALSFCTTPYRKALVE
jgi:hypothetical protein